MILFISMFIAITLSKTITTNLIAFIVPLAIGVIFLVLFIKVEKRAKSPLVNLKLAFYPVIFTGNIMMLMFGILQYFVITGIPQLGSAPPPSGLGLDPLKVGFLQLSFGLSMTLNNTNILFTPKEYTGISSAATNMMRIVGGAIGPVMTTVILASITVSASVDNVATSY